METVLKEFKLAGGQSVWVEAISQPLPGRVNIAEPATTVGSFEKAWDDVYPAVTTLSEKLKKLSPDGVEVKFGLTLKAEVGAISSKGSAEGNFEVTLKWGK
jgi:hypothetical protein